MAIPIIDAVKAIFFIANTSVTLGLPKHIQTFLAIDGEIDYDSK
jgi:hypothetical protein